MKQNGLKIVLILVMLGFAAKIQANGNVANIFTDRNCYVAGDVVFVKINLLNETDELTIYVDICDGNDNLINGEIFRLADRSSSGYIMIPDTVKTGNYFIRTYTHHSVNNGIEKVLDKNLIYVTNRFGNNADIFEANKKPSNTVDTLNFEEVSIGTIEASIDKTIYNKRSKVTLSLRQNASDVCFDGAVSVRAISECNQQIAVSEDDWWRHIDSKLTAKVKKQVVNETKGIIVSGVAKNKTTQSVLPNLTVLLAFNDSVLRVKYSITDSLGRFNFLVNDFVDNQEVFLSAYLYPSMELYTNIDLSIDNKFFPQSLINKDVGKVIDYEISNDSLNLLKTIIAKAYNISVYEKNEENACKSLSYEHKFLAGEINRLTHIDDYIDLPDFYEIAREILPFVKIREKQGLYNIALLDGENNVVRPNSMVFVDGVPLTSLNEIMSWGSDKIKKVEVQTEPRYYGDIPFEKGLVFIWTRKNDFWENAICPNTKRFVIPCYQKPLRFIFPDYSKNNEQKKLPDFRPIMYWNPDVKVSDNNVDVEFYTSDESGKFEIYISGFNNNGEPIFVKKYFEVQ